jgi:hypothetical protein
LAPRTIAMPVSCLSQACREGLRHMLTKQYVGDVSAAKNLRKAEKTKDQLPR